MQMTKDPYRSRTAPEPAIVPRKDPVLHGEPDGFQDGPLDETQLSRFQRDGFIHLDGLLTRDEVNSLQEELHRRFEVDADSEDPRVVREPQGHAVRSIFKVHDDDLFGDLAADPRLVRIAEQILGSEVYVHQSRINFKPGFAGKEFDWHSDFETWHVEDGMPRMRALSMSIALSKNTPNNGPLMVIPGSHQHYIVCVGGTPEDHYKSSLRKQEFGVPDADSLTWLVEKGGIVASTGNAGTITIFECNTMHGSNSNITPMPRSNMFLVYNSIHNRLTSPYGGSKPRPEFIATRETCKPIRLAA